MSTWLIGIDHEFQQNDKLPKASMLCTFLIELINKFSIDLIGEECSTDALNLSVDSTVAHKIAKQFKIRHKYCDPDEETRIIIGYPTQKQLRNKFGLRSAFFGTDEYKKRKEYEKDFWIIREKYWLDQIDNLTSRNIAFICGYSHLNSFKSLLLKNGFSVTTKKI